MKLRIPFIAALAAVWLSAAPAGAQAPTAPTLKAAFLYNFARFTEWPAEALAAKQKLTLCVMGDASVADALERTIEGRFLEGHPLAMRIVGMDESIGSCHLLYASGLDKRGSKQLLQTLTGPAVFTVSDSDGFAELGGVAQLILEGDRMRFAVNVSAAQRARLRLSSKLLTLAVIVKDQRDVRHN